MPNAPGAGRENGPDQYDWVHIEDFSPGCYDAGLISIETPYDNAPIGAAYLPNTYQCAAIKGGALGPLPAIVFQQALSSWGSLPGSATALYVVGFAVTPRMTTENWEAIMIQEADDGTHHYVRAYYQQYPAASLTSISGPTETVATTPGFFGAPYPYWTRMTSSGSGNPPPVLVFPTAVATDSSNPNGHLWVYPELLSPGTATAQDLIVSGSSTTGQVLTYGNRVIVATGVGYTHPGDNINTNENLNYTDPPESSTYGAQETVFSIENPWGYGAFGTVSVGELLMVKKVGGGLIMNGDINAPTSVIRMPGIQSTGGFVGRAGTTTMGLVYCSQDNGAWVWNGGNTSTKISQNINDSFYDLATGNITSNNFGFFVEQWNKWLMFSNNVMYDTDTGGWWQLYPNKANGGRDLWWYAVTNTNSQLATAPLRATSNSDYVLSVFDNTVPSVQYQWQSLPIHVTPNASRLLDIRQVVVRASQPDGDPNSVISVILGGVDPATFWSSANALGEIGTTPSTLRFNVGYQDAGSPSPGANGVDDIIIGIFAQNQNAHSAPIIHSIDVGYQIRQKAPVVN